MAGTFDGRFHEVPNRLEDRLEPRVVLALERVQALEEIPVAGSHRPEADEDAHDLDVDLDGALAVQHAGEHGHALFGEGMGSVPAAAAPGL